MGSAEYQFSSGRPRLGEEGMQILHHQIQIHRYIFFLRAFNMLMQVANLQKGFGLLTFLIVLEPATLPSQSKGTVV